MIRYALMLTALTFALALPVEASRCPTEMALIDAALPTAEVSAEDKARVAELRRHGEAMHKAGNHAGAEAALDEAKEILGI